MEQAEYADRRPQLVKEEEVVVPVIPPAVGTGIFLQRARAEAMRLYRATNPTDLNTH